MRWLLPEHVEDVLPAEAAKIEALRRALLDLADRHGLAIVADEVYGDLGYDGPVSPIGSLDPDAPIITFSSLSKAYLAPGWRAEETSSFP